MAFQYELFNVLRAYFHLPKVQMTAKMQLKESKWRLENYRKCSINLLNLRRMGKWQRI